jgi:inosine/xanthosine triphosphate pyrophosphatase family protein
MALRRLALITRNPRKAEEWMHYLKPQGVTCRQVMPTGDLLEQVRALQESDQYNVICRERTSLRSMGKEVESEDFQHLALVDHHCSIRAWYRTEQGWEQHTFEGIRAGYFDLSGNLEAGGWWDSCFRDARTGLSYQEQARARGGKLSARVVALDQLMEFFAPARRQARHLGFSFEPQVVDLERSVRAEVLSNRCFTGLGDSLLGRLVDAALARGLFTSVGRTRSQQVYFWPGLSGLPSVPRDSEVDEAKFLFHDLVHFLIGRLVPDGPMSEHERRVFVSWAMVEEAIALMLADGYFVDQLARSGVRYDFDQHKGYPFFRALGLAGQPLREEKLREVLWANVSFFVLGDRSAFESLGLDLEDPRARAYLDGFERFSLGDWLWNERMSLHARADADVYARWWRLAEPINRRAGLSILTAREAASLVAGGHPEQLVRGVFDTIMDRRLLAPPAEPGALPEQEKARWRWLVGQLGFFAAHAQLPALEQAGRLLSRAEQFEPLPAFLKQCLQVAVEAGLCTPHQAAWWGDFYPLFPPYYISYRARPGLTVAGLARRILSAEGGARLLENELGVAAAVICDAARQRFLLERKTNHPNPLFEGRYGLVGGFRQRPEEAAPVAWRREATEEWADPLSRQLAHQLADLAVPWRRFRFQGVELPGDWDMDVLLIELDGAQFEAASRVLLAQNSPANRPEGWLAVVERGELAELPLLSGHDVALEQFLAHSPLPQAAL